MTTVTNLLRKRCVTDIMVAVAPRGVRHMCVRMTWMDKSRRVQSAILEAAARAPESAGRPVGPTSEEPTSPPGSTEPAKSQRASLEEVGRPE